MTNPETTRPITEGDQPILPPTICHLIDDKLLEAESVTERVALAGEPGMEDALLTCSFKNARPFKNALLTRRRGAAPRQARGPELVERAGLRPQD